MVVPTYCSYIYFFRPKGTPQLRIMHYELRIKKGAALRCGIAGAGAASRNKKCSV